MLHTQTPSLQVIDPRRLNVRGVAYHRREAAAATQAYITQQVHDAAGRAVLSRDPRLFCSNQRGEPAANQQTVFSLTGAVLLAQNVDAGWRLGLFGAHGQPVAGWDQKLSQSHVEYDLQCRPVATFERPWQGAEHCIARLTYAGSDADAGSNQRGQMIRHDDTAGTLLFTEFSLHATPLQHSRTFLADPRWQVDWPVSVPARDVLLEIEPAFTRLQSNAAGETISQMDAVGNRQTFDHDAAGQLWETRIKLAGHAAETTLVRDIRYNAFGQIEQQCAGNGVVSSATFSPNDGRLQHLKAGVPGQPALQDLTYEYDAVGNVTGIADGADVTRYQRNQRIDPVSRYRYDSLYRLIEATGRQVRNAPGGPQLPDFQSPADSGQQENYRRSYTYDEAGNLTLMQHQADSGNRTERTAVARLSNRSLPQTPDGQLPDEQQIALAYDLNGNRRELQSGQALQWDLRNQLRQVAQLKREDGPDDCESYLYDSGGRRQQKIRQADTGTLIRTHETRYLPGVEIRKWAGQALHVMTIQAGRSTVQILHWPTEPPSGITQDQHRYSFSDQLGSSTLELDEAASLISWEGYYPYGATSWWAGRNRLEASYKTLRYCGQERDASGLYYYGLRYYIPWCQRWLNADPAGTADGLNLYAMVHGNPIGHVDLQGLITVGQGLSAAAATIGRDGLSALAGGAVRFLAGQLLTQYSSNSTEDSDGQAVTSGTNLALTVAGATVGILAGGSMGMGAGSNIASRYSDHRSVKRLGAALGAVVGAAAGAATPLYTYWSNPDQLNTVAISLISAMAGNLTRETGQRVSADLGRNITLPPEGVATAARTAVYAGQLFAGGLLKAELSPLLGVAVGAAVEGLDGASAVAINAWRGGDFTEGGRSLSRPKSDELLYGWATRTAGSSLTASLTALSTPLTEAIANPILRQAVIDGMATPTEARTLAGQQVKAGFSELTPLNDWNPRLDQHTPATISDVIASSSSEIEMRNVRRLSV